MAYILEDQRESERLERQAREPQYDCRAELAGLDLSGCRAVLDAGCGSGVMARELAVLCPDAQVLGADLDGGRLGMARGISAGLRNLRFEQHDLSRLRLPDGGFDAILCRYVFQHLPQHSLSQVAGELARVLGAGGVLRIIDVDGMMGNVFPLSRELAAGIHAIQCSGMIDMHIGRRLPGLLRAAGFSQVDWQVLPMVFQGRALACEYEQYEARFAAARPHLAAILGGTAQAQQFEAGFLEALRSPDCVLFYSKFIVTARR
jgi:ubiquinone/menaquinone biosynthesis C-methylase UbiE